MSKMSINVFKKHPGNKVTFSNRAILSGKLKIMGSHNDITHDILCPWFQEV